MISIEHNNELDSFFFSYAIVQRKADTFNLFMIKYSVLSALVRHRIAINAV